LFMRWIGARPVVLADHPIMKSYANRERDAIRRADSKALGRVRRERKARLHQALGARR
jgi:hypothetical protein